MSSFKKHEEGNVRNEYALIFFIYYSFIKIPMIRGYRAKILLIRRKTLINQSILDIFCLQTFTLSVLLITGSYGEAHRNNIIRKRTSIILIIAFVLVDFQSPSGILSNVAYPISQAVLLA